MEKTIEGQRLPHSPVLLLCASLCILVTSEGISEVAQTNQRISGDFHSPAHVALPLPADGEGYSIRAKAVEVGGGLRIQLGESKATVIRIECVDMPNLNHHWGTTKVPKGLKDAALLMEVSGVVSWKRRYRKHYFIRPDLHFYYGDDYKKALEKWPSLPGASEHEFALRVTRLEGRIQLWMDGRFFTSFPMEKAWREIGIQLTGKGEVRSVHHAKAAETDRFVPLDISDQSHRGDLEFKGGTVSAGLNLPIRLVKSGSVDVGLSRWLRQSQDSMSFYSPYSKRSCWDAVPESIIFSVPNRHYNAVHVLCAVDPSKHKSPTMSVRLARYRQSWDGTGATQADTTIRVDPERLEGCESIRQVGTVRVKLGLRSRSLPLYLVTIPLKTGELADFLGRDDWDSNYERTDYFYLEFCRELGVRASRNYGVFERLPLGPESGVHIFGATLEKTPVQVSFQSDEVGNVFYKDKNPRLRLEIVNPSKRPIKLELTTAFKDFKEKTEDSSQEISVKPGTTKLPINLAGRELGWHEAEFTFKDETGRTIWNQSTVFALLPPDTRKAGSESPYGTWWFEGSHYSESDANLVLPLIQKMGFRHVTPPKKDERKNVTPANYARHKMTPSMMRRIREGKKKGGSLEEQVQKFMTDWPATGYAMIFHETHLGGLGLEIPPELFGRPPLKLEGKDQERYKTLVEHAERHSSAIRKLAPNTKIILGNGGTNFNVHWLRTKLPRKHWDAIGLEMAIQLFHPEGQPTGWNLQSMWIAKRMREIYGYEDMPITSCYEFDYRSTAPGALSLKQQADWYARDVLHCLAYRMPNINVALIMDCNSSYYSSRWGATGVCFRAPDMLPKPSYVALSTLTRELDQAEYLRWLDTGSTGLYCLEFKRKDGFVYALWATRGQRKVEIRFARDDGQYRICDLMGRNADGSVRNGTASLTASESPGFLSSSVQLASISAAVLSAPDNIPSDAVILDKLDNPDGWKLIEEGDSAFQNYCAYKPMAKGKTLKQKGSDGGMQITLVSQPDIPDLVGRYAIYEPARGPIKIPGRPRRIGVSINGNSNWGRIYFEIIDAKGRRWTSNGWEEAPNSWDMSDWEAETAINFDGWRFISVGLPFHYGSGYYSPGFRHWRCQGDNSTTNQLEFPIRFNRLYLVLREKLVYVNEMIPAKSMSIELKDLSAVP